MGDKLAPRTMQDTQIRIYKNAYSDEFCDKVINAWNSLQKTSSEKEDHDWSDTNFRRDKAVFMDVIEADVPQDEIIIRTKITQEFYDTLLPNVDDYLKDIGIFKNVYCKPHHMKIQKYDYTRSGGYYAFHCEQSILVSEVKRLLTYLLYLNDVPEGEGETEFMYQGVRNQPCKGDLVIFPAFFTHIHRGNPVYTTDKYIATGWMMWADNPDNPDNATQK